MTRGAILLALGLVLVVAPLASVADDAVATVDLSKVTCGSTIKLKHSATKTFLHSHDIA